VSASSDLSWPDSEIEVTAQSHCGAGERLLLSMLAVYSPIGPSVKL